MLMQIMAYLKRADGITLGKQNKKSFPCTKYEVLPK